MENISQDEVNLIANALFAKSRFKNGLYISKTTGLTVEFKTVSEVMAFNIAEYMDSNVRKASMIFEALKTLAYIQSNEREHMEEVNIIWAFFAEYFNGMYGVKIELSLLFRAYMNEFRNTSKREFNDDLAQWCLEMNLPRTVKNEGVIKKIIVIRN